jgi:hypothetical protein
MRMVLDGTEDKEPAIPAEIDRAVFLENHSGSGQPCIGIVLRTKEGTLVEGITSLALFETAAKAFAARADALGYRYDPGTGRRVKP